MHDNPEIKSLKTSSQLDVHEWAAVLLIVGFLTFLAVIVFDEQYDSRVFTGPPSYLKPQTMEVWVEGAVKNPGSYLIKAGTKIKEVITLAQPLPEADLRRIKSSSSVKNGQGIVIPSKVMIEIQVEGAVEMPGKLQVPRGTRLNQLKEYVVFKEEADLSKIDRKRILRVGESVVVPLKKSKD